MIGLVITLWSLLLSDSHCDWKTRLSGVDDGKATKDEILADPKLYLYNECGGQPPENTLYLGRFSITSSRAVDDTRTSHSRSGELTPEQIQLIRRCRRGDKIYVEEIMVDCPDCTYRKMPPIVILIE
jgi:hypothetical protein